MGTEIVGKWTYKDGEVQADSNCKIIESMIKNDLTEIGSTEGGWGKRCEDNAGTIWELTYPESHLSGGGPPKLAIIESQS